MSVAATSIAAPRRALRLRRPSALPGFGLALGYTLFYLGLIVIIPLAALVLRASSIGFSGLINIATDERVAAALKVSFGLSFAAAAVDTIFGLLIAWVMVRYRFPGRKLLDAAIDLPFALPTAVAGIALAALYAPNGWIGSLFNFPIAFTPLGIFIALVFVGLPFAVRTVEPLIADIDRELEEAAATLGASRTRAIFTVLLPPLIPAMLTGFALAFGRAVGEYGSVIFIAGNKPYISEIAPLLIIVKLEEFNYTGATAIATIMLAISFVTLLAINLLQAYSRRRFGHV
ncbi:sulfate transport system permease protein CysT [Variibacter gotjawalensis]|jgi:sulfate/thiosulfate transport system permease protein|uniref:Sulfate transport system permease protein CysT n=1 Tax=Variibacter gotjawalensis TaxID=1333996 RepID=A0A0S3PQS0_9BRAD|nr:sulfate ABC transporter permease subunit CysT [Variibacter gotjawalensis]NIK48606.1 sulfate transport system permease protein [Variibacter gotjawalensis]RZS50471.1 sulfate transport system permease protein [Variibacter gotjawalensis]BAT58305.1 sulfate transport system permease protein CysT [Variibacter gotjawalensis]